jgi:hypothetical protein
VQIFDLFDVKRNGVIEFGEFVRSLSVFHPRTPESEKTTCMRVTRFRSLFPNPFSIIVYPVTQILINYSCISAL